MQTVSMTDGTGFDIYLLSTYRNTLHRYYQKSAMTHLGAMNLGLDLCAALAVCRKSGYLYVVAEEHQDSASFVADEQGNLSERNVPHVDLFIWPQLFDHAQYRITIYEETESAWISVNSTGHFIPDKSLSEADQFKAKELYEKHQLEIRNILDAAAWLWGSNI